MNTDTDADMDMPGAWEQALPGGAASHLGLYLLYWGVNSMVMVCSFALIAIFSRDFSRSGDEIAAFFYLMPLLALAFFAISLLALLGHDVARRTQLCAFATVGALLCIPALAQSAIPVVFFVVLVFGLPSWLLHLCAPLTVDDSFKRWHCVGAIMALLVSVALISLKM